MGLIVARTGLNGSPQRFRHFTGDPLSVLHARGPYELDDLILGLLVHMVVIGLPISHSVRRFGI